MKEYVWELGIDWNAIQTGGVGYLRGGLTEAGVPSPGTTPVKSGDQITFRIFDVSSSVPAGRRVAAVASFGIDSQAAVEGQLQLPDGPLSKTQPTIGSPNESAPQSSLFGDSYCSWDSEPVVVNNAPGRFLLVVYLQATGMDGVVRLFNHDPEMVVGPNT
jgi:hypothetical protein